MTKQRTKLEHLVLAEGEHTGHRHVASTGVLFAEPDGGMTWESGPRGTVTHEEHAPVQAPARENTVERVLEYDHAAEEARQVRD